MGESETLGQSEALQLELDHLDLMKEGNEELVYRLK